MPDVTFKHPKYKRFKERADYVHDVVSDEVQEKGVIYLPALNSSTDKKENEEAYQTYLKRAVFVNYTGNFLKQLCGKAFTKVPVFEKPDFLKYAEDDLDGSDNSIYQQSQKALEYSLKFGRAGVLVDFPRVTEQTTAVRNVADVKKANLRPTATLFDGRLIINWKTKRVGGRNLLSLVVLENHQDKTTGDGFGTETVEQYLVLRLDEIGYKREYWQKAENSAEWLIVEQDYITDGFGKIWQEIPFTFLGPQTNDPDVDESPVYPMAKINIAHYRNSAEFEHGVFYCGHPQAYTTGIDYDTYKWMEAEGVLFGAASVFPVPTGESMGLVQADFTKMGAKVAKEEKVKEMIAIGLRIVEPGGAKTATQADSDNEAQHSILSLAVSNVSEAYTKVLEWMAIFSGVKNAEVSYKINQDFNRSKIDPNMLTAVLSAFTSGTLPQSELWRLFREYGLIDAETDDETLKAELEASLPALPFDDTAEADTAPPQPAEAEA